MTPDPSVTDVLAQFAVTTLGSLARCFWPGLRKHVRISRRPRCLAMPCVNSVGAAQRAAEKGIREYGTDGRLIGVPEDMRAALQVRARPRWRRDGPSRHHPGGGGEEDRRAHRSDQRGEQPRDCRQPAPTQPPLAPVPSRAHAARANSGSGRRSPTMKNVLSALAILSPLALAACSGTAEQATPRCSKCSTGCTCRAVVLLHRHAHWPLSGGPGQHQRRARDSDRQGGRRGGGSLQRGGGGARAPASRPHRRASCGSRRAGCGHGPLG
jgi:hypothetical protein